MTDSIIVVNDSTIRAEIYNLERAVSSDHVMNKGEQKVQVCSSSNSRKLEDGKELCSTSKLDVEKHNLPACVSKLRAGADLDRVLGAMMRRSITWLFQERSSKLIRIMGINRSRISTHCGI